MKRTILATAVFAAFIIGASIAQASPVGGIAERAPPEGMVSRVATFVCIRDDRGWHYMRGNRRIVCRPARPKGAFWGWRCEGKRCGWWHRNERRWND